MHRRENRKAKMQSQKIGTIYGESIETCFSRWSTLLAISELKQAYKKPTKKEDISAFLLNALELEP
jgi:hypothetical protein